MKIEHSIKCAISQNTSFALKGLFSILVIICHVRGEIDSFNGTLIGKIATQFGYLSVSIFFFLSGYGLWKRSKENSHYLNTFLKNRVLFLYLQYVLVLFFYTALFLIRDSKVDFSTFVQSFLFGKTLVPYGWYFQAITVFYFIFYLACRFLDKRIQIVGIACGLCLYSILCAFWKLSTTWYETSFAFLTGMLLVQYEYKIEYILLRRILEKCIGLFFLTLITILLGAYKSLGCFAVFFKMSSAVLFCLLVYYVSIVCSKFEYSFVAVFLKKIGTISLEIYAFQGFIILFILNPIVGNGNPIFILSLSIVLVVCCAMIVHPVFKKIRKVVK